jgi:hypothetical protein
MRRTSDEIRAADALRDERLNATELLSGGKVGAACLGRTTEAVEDLRARLALRVVSDLAASAPVEVR